MTQRLIAARESNLDISSTDMESDDGNTSIYETELTEAKDSEGPESDWFSSEFEEDESEEAAHIHEYQEEQDAQQQQQQQQANEANVADEKPFWQCYDQMLEVHQNNTASVRIRRNPPKTGPNKKELSKAYKNMPKELKEATVSYGSHTKYTKATKNQTNDALEGCLNPLQFMWLVAASTHIAQYIAKCTNKKMKKKRRQNPNKKEYQEWKDIDHVILMMCVFIKAEMAFTLKTSMKRHWEDKRGSQWIKDVMQRDIFLRIWRNLAAYDCDKDPMSYSSSDRLDNGFKGSKLWRMWSKYGAIFWILDLFVVLDEYMIDSLCRWISKARIKAKKHSIGIKIFKVSILILPYPPSPPPLHIPGLPFSLPFSAPLPPFANMFPLLLI
eukprot:507429_1